jgi:hypothetical protein
MKEEIKTLSSRKAPWERHQLERVLQYESVGV